MSTDREEELREEGRKQERARLLAVLKRHDQVKLHNGQIFMPYGFIRFAPVPEVQAEWDGVK